MNTEEKIVLKERLLIFLRGLFMGMADIVPGISGGTIALITGIYERLIFAIKGINIRFILYILRGDTERARKHLFSMDLDFLITLFLGIMTAFLIFSRVIRFMMAEYPANTYAFFFGLILASAAFVYKLVGEINHRTVLSGIMGFLFAFFFVGIGTFQSTHSLPVIFISGMISICAMILPGISGAFILFFLGQYEYLLTTLYSFDLLTIAAFMSGGVTGLFGTARILSYLLKNHKAVTMSFLIGIMLGALRMPYESVVSSAFYLPFVLVSGAIGFLAVVLLEKMADKLRVDS